VEEELRKVARDAYVTWESSPYLVPWRFVGAQVWVVERGAEVEVRHGAERIAVHSRAMRRHQVVTRSEHHFAVVAPLCLLAKSARKAANRGPQNPSRVLGWS